MPLEPLGCRHGLALLINRGRLAVVWGPLTGHLREVDFPPALDPREAGFPPAPGREVLRNAAVLCAARNDGHAHGACGRSPFKLVLVSNDAREPSRASAYIYESESGARGNAISTATTHAVSFARAAVMVGSTLCWSLRGGDVLELDFQRDSLAAVRKPVDPHITNYSIFQVLRTEDGGLGLAVLTKFSMQLWERKADCDGVVAWVLHRTVHLGQLFGLRPFSEEAPVLVLGYDGDNNAIFLNTVVGVFMLRLDSMHFRDVPDLDYMRFKTYFPYTNSTLQVSKEKI